MGEKIEFEAVARWAYGDPGHLTLDVPRGKAINSLRYHVTLELMEPKLKPCPFCGSDAQIVERETGSFAGVRVVCISPRCGAQGKSLKTTDTESREYVIQAWNQRADNA